MSAGFGNETAATAGARQLAKQPITVTAHAVIRARTRRHYGDHHDLPGDQVAQAIAADVAQAIAAGRVADHRPVWSTPYSLRELGGAKPKCIPCRPGTRFVWDEPELHGWIVKDDETGGLVVLTALHRVRAHEAAA